MERPRRNNKRPYTELDIEKIKKWRAAGLTMLEIATLLHRSLGSIGYLCYRLDIQGTQRENPKWNKANKQLLTKLFQQGKSINFVANTFGVSIASISQVMTRCRQEGYQIPYCKERRMISDKQKIKKISKNVRHNIA